MDRTKVDAVHQLRWRVRLHHLMAVHHQPSVGDRDRVAPEPDDPLDQHSAMFRTTEGHHVSPLPPVVAPADLVGQDVLSGMQGRRHAGGLDSERLGDEVSAGHQGSQQHHEQREAARKPLGAGLPSRPVRHQIATGRAAVIGSNPGSWFGSPTLNCIIMSWSSWTRLWQCIMYRPRGCGQPSPAGGPENRMATRTVSFSPTYTTSLGPFSYGMTLLATPLRDRTWKSTRWM